MYWDVEAARAADAVARATCQQDVYDALVKALRHLVRPPEDDHYVRGRIDASSTAIWRWTCNLPVHSCDLVGRRPARGIRHVGLPLGEGTHTDFNREMTRRPLGNKPLRAQSPQ